MLELVSTVFDLEDHSIQDTFYGNDKVSVQMDNLRFELPYRGILSLLTI